MKRIWFTQQQPYDFMPLRAGLGLITLKELKEYNLERARTKKADEQPFLTLLPKFYTTRTHKLEGEYQVVEGSRFKAKPVEPEIKFTAELIGQINFKTCDWDGVSVRAFILGHVLKNIEVIGEDDLGYEGATLETLRDELLRLNKKATTDTPFYVHRLWGINPITDSEPLSMGGVQEAQKHEEQYVQVLNTGMGNGHMISARQKHEEQYVQVLNPRTDRWAKIDRNTGNIISHKKSKGEFKGIYKL
ncbi:MAG: hypothetical protein PHW62_00350 [Candidatus Ratteibacteria bacterium]|nr:hypothetical protein [Candidatus Ratteibacteria bacterium]